MADDSTTIFSDSTTLVDPSQNKYRLGQDNPCNTIIFSPARRPLYSVETTFDGGTVTTVRKLPADQSSTVNAQNGEFVASLHWNDFLDDKVKVGDESPVRLRKILGVQLVNLARTASFKDAQGRKYQWQGYAPGMSLKVCPSFHTSHPSALPSGISRAVTLMITTRTHNPYSFMTLKIQQDLYSLRRFIVHAQISKQVYASQHVWRLSHEAHMSLTQSSGVSYSWRRTEGPEVDLSMEFKHRPDRSSCTRKVDV
jgi:hypothetical protein